jgi:hypothetical protein
MFHGRDHTMFSKGRLAARSTLAAGLLMALAVLTATPALAETGAVTAPAARTAAADTGFYTTWAAAQKAAGFSLYVPKRTAGLARVEISVGRCKAPHKAHFDVGAQWGTAKTVVLFDQNTTSAACPGRLPKLSPLATYKVHGVTYTLIGACGVAGLPPCTSKRAVLAMTWKIGPHHFRAISKGFLRGALLSFATSIKNR